MNNTNRFAFASTLALRSDLITTEKRAAWCCTEKQVSWRVLSDLGSFWPNGGGGKAIRRGGERWRIVSRRTVMGFI